MTARDRPDDACVTDSTAATYGTSRDARDHRGSVIDHAHRSAPTAGCSLRARSGQSIVGSRHTQRVAASRSAIERRSVDVVDLIARSPRSVGHDLVGCACPGRVAGSGRRARGPARAAPAIGSPATSHWRAEVPIRSPVTARSADAVIDGLSVRAMRRGRDRDSTDVQAVERRLSSQAARPHGVERDRAPRPRQPPQPSVDRRRSPRLRRSVPVGDSSGRSGRSGGATIRAADCLVVL